MGTRREALLMQARQKNKHGTTRAHLLPLALRGRLGLQRGLPLPVRGLAVRLCQRLQVLRALGGARAVVGRLERATRVALGGAARRLRLR
jgi:hypothetical protein